MGAINRKRAAANKLRNMVERKVNQTIAVDKKIRSEVQNKRMELNNKINMIKGNLRKNFMKKVPEIKQRLGEVRSNLRKEAMEARDEEAAQANAKEMERVRAEEEEERKRSPLRDAIERGLDRRRELEEERSRTRRNLRH